MSSGEKSPPRVAPERPRLLHRHSHHGYTDRPDLAMFGEPEAVSADTQDWITYRAQRSQREAQLQEWCVRRAAIQREVDWLYSQHLDRSVTRALCNLRRQLEHIDRCLTGRADRDVSQTTRPRQPRLPVGD